MSKLGMPSCTAQITVPPLSGCSAAPIGAPSPRVYPHTTKSSNVSLQSHTSRGVDHGLAQTQYRSTTHLLRLQVMSHVTWSVYILWSHTGVKNWDKESWHYWSIVAVYAEFSKDYRAIAG